MPIASGAVSRPWKSKRHSPSLRERWPKAGVTPPGSDAVWGVVGSRPSEGSTSIIGAGVVGSVARAGALPAAPSAINV